MIEQADEVNFTAKIRTQIIKQIFKDLGPKHLKGVQNFYAICSKDNVELQFVSSAKDLLITIILKKNLFLHFLYNQEKPSLHRYCLDDFTCIGFLFQNNKQILDLEITTQTFILTNTGGNGQTQFIGQSLNCDEDDQELLISEKDLRPSDNDWMKLKFAKVGIFEGILRYAKANKLNSLWFRYNSVNQKLQVTDKKQGQEIKWLLKVEQSHRNTYNCQLELHYKMLDCAINLLPNDSELILTFYSTFVLLDVPQKQKTFTIRLNAKQQLI